MRVEGTGGAAVSRVNDPEFAMFATRSGRDILSDLERAHAPIVSPIQLSPLTKAEEAALYAEDRPARRKLIPPARVRDPRTPAPPARLPAPGPAPLAGEPSGPSVAPQPTSAGRGQTTTWRARPGKLDQAQIVADYYSGMTGRAVSKLHGCHEVSVTHILNTWHVVRLPRGGKLPGKIPAPQPGPPVASSLEVCEVITDLTNDLQPSLRTTVRRLSQAGFSQIEMAVYAGTTEQAIREALLSAGIRTPHRDHWISA